MTDNPRKRGPADRSRIALEQAHERRYLLEYLETASADLRFAIEELEGAEQAIQRAADRLHAGFPRAAKRRGKGRKS